MGVRCRIGVGDVILKTLRVTLGMARGQCGQTTLLRRTLVRVAYQQLSACLGPNPELFGLFLIKDCALMHAVDFDPETIFAAGTELTDHCRSCDVVRCPEQ